MERFKTQSDFLYGSKGRRLLAWLAACCWLVASSPGRTTPVVVPEPLQPWTEWVLHGVEDINCPFFPGDFASKQCLWPGLLTLELSPQGLAFRQHWQVYGEALVTLPGSEGYWPQDVSASGRDLVVVERDGLPVVRLSPGDYELEGHIPWQVSPDSLLIAPGTALVQVKESGALRYPRVEADGRLWLVDRQGQEPNLEQGNQERLTVRVYRKLVDDLPLRLLTRVELEVGGKPREISLGAALPEAMAVESFESPLPARLENSGQLRVQLRPGSWGLEFSARAAAPMGRLAMSAGGEVWPGEEVWVFEARPELRQVRLDGLAAMDPNQTTLPEAWKNLPAYLIQPGQNLILEEMRRGDPEPAPNQLSLERRFWLDFDGKGFTVEDHLFGTMNRDWRLNVGAQLQLGRLELNGQPQVITHEQGQHGVEVRSRQLDVRALGRIETDAGAHGRSLSAIGWTQDVERLSASLQLPPGWSLFTVIGADSSEGSWTGVWTVWDVFIVLIAVVALWRLRGAKAALLFALALLLIYPKDDSFLYLWLNLIVVLGLLRVLPLGRLRLVVHRYGVLAGLALVVWQLGFMVSEARLVLYPQLDEPSSYHSPSWPGGGRASESVDYAQESVASGSMADMAAPVLMKSAGRLYNRPQPAFETTDPNLAAQTGPGRPQWEWRQVTWSWSGPVTQGEAVTVVLLTPLENRVLSALRVLLCVLVLLPVFGIRRSGGGWIWGGFGTPVTAALLVMLSLSLFPAPPLYAMEAPANTGPGLVSGVPGQDVLETLKQRLRQEQDCTPACLGIERGQIMADGGRLTLRLSVHALGPMVFSLPDSQQQWLVDGVLVDGDPGTLRNDNGSLSLALVTGRHEVELTGRVVTAQDFQLSFPVLPHNLNISSRGWQITGIEGGRLLGNALYFSPEPSRSAAPEASRLSPDPAAPYVTVERILNLGLTWSVQTRVIRVAPRSGAIQLAVPLLPGETLTTAGFEVRDGKVMVSLSGDQEETSWYSSLEQTDRILLLADDSGLWSEHWQVRPAPLWHVLSAGLAPVKEMVSAGDWSPRWRPYPGESLPLVISRPQAVPGVTSTLHQVEQEWHLGDRDSRGLLTLAISTSRGSEQEIKLPPGARVQGVRVDGEARAVAEDEPHLRLPLTPGEHRIEVEWHQSEMLGWRWATPVLDVAAPYVNHRIGVAVPADRWLLFVGGPALGPAVLFWGVALVTLLLAFALGRWRVLPLGSGQWMLLALGLCAGWIELLVPVVLWFVALHARGRMDLDGLSRGRFHLMQVALALFTLGVFGLLLAAIPGSLLGSPDMGVTGYGSSQALLNWYVDRGQGSLDQAWFVSIPLWVYRGLMLLWSLWLALSLLKWLRWGWQAYSSGGYWRAAPDQGPRPG